MIGIEKAQKIPDPYPPRAPDKANKVAVAPFRFFGSTAKKDEILKAQDNRKGILLGIKPFYPLPGDTEEDLITHRPNRKKKSLPFNLCERSTWFPQSTWDRER
jgi:hypothetical protein